MQHLMIVLLLYINSLKLSSIKKKMSIFEEYVAFNPCMPSGLFYLKSLTRQFLIEGMSGWF